MKTATKRVAVFGSTGAIGRQAVQVVEHLHRDFRVSALVAHSQVKQLARQAWRLRPDCCVVGDESRLDELTSELRGSHVRALGGPEAMERVAGDAGSDIVVMGLAGTGGLRPTLAALKAGRRVALATKEIMVGFGRIVMEQARRQDATLLPVDSELSAIHQCLNSGLKSWGSRPVRVILTASGGPFFRRRDLRGVTVEQALAHPTWRMGPKITVDSATMMNKGLEVIEAANFFGLVSEQVEVLVHPQSVVHSLVEFADGSQLAQLALPDMRLPIQYALTYPRRVPGLVRRLRLDAVGRLEFFSPRRGLFPCLDLAYQALREDGIKPCVLSAANESAVRAFLAGRLAFSGIPKVVAATMRAFPNLRRPSLRQLLDAESGARRESDAFCERMQRQMRVERSAN